MWAEGRCWIKMISSGRIEVGILLKVKDGEGGMNWNRTLRGKRKDFQNVD